MDTGSTPVGSTRLLRLIDTLFVSLNYFSYICSMKHITTDKGDIGVLLVSADLIKKGIPIFTPISATCPFDLLIYYNNFFKRVQVKYRSILNGTLSVNLKRNTIVNGKNVSSFKNEEVDILAIYCKDNSQIYYIDSKEISKTITLRIDNSKNNQMKNVKFAKDYIDL